MEDLSDAGFGEDDAATLGLLAGRLALVLDLARLGQGANGALDRALPEGMTMAKFQVLDLLARLGVARGPAQIARSMGVTKAAMTQTLARLSETGLVSISEDPRDGRGKLVEITRRGEDMRIACHVRLRDPLAELSSLLSEEEWRGFGAAMDRLRAGLDAQRTEAGR